MSTARRGAENPSRRPSSRSRRAAQLVVAVLVVLVVALALEQSFRGRARNSEAGDPRLSRAFDDLRYQPDAKLLWRPRAGVEGFNPLGHRGPEADEETAIGGLRVLVLGDGGALEGGQEGEGWPELLQDRLGGGVEVINGAVTDYSSYQVLARMRQLASLGAEVVLIGPTEEDARPVRVPDEVFAANYAFLRWGLMRPLWRLAARLPLWGEALQPRVAPDALGGNLRAAIAEAKRAGARVLLITRPYSLSEPLESEYWLADLASYNRVAVEVAEEEGCVLIDLFTLVKKRPDLFASPSLLSSEGHEEVARLVSVRLQAAMAAVRTVDER